MLSLAMRSRRAFSRATLRGFRFALERSSASLTSSSALRTLGCLISSNSTAARRYSSSTRRRAVSNSATRAPRALWMARMSTAPVIFTVFNSVWKRSRRASPSHDRRWRPPYRPRVADTYPPSPRNDPISRWRAKLPPEGWRCTVGSHWSPRLGRTRETDMPTSAKTRGRHNGSELGGRTICASRGKTMFLTRWGQQNFRSAYVEGTDRRERTTAELVSRRPEVFPLPLVRPGILCPEACVHTLRLTMAVPPASTSVIPKSEQKKAPQTGKDKSLVRLTPLAHSSSAATTLPDPTPPAPPPGPATVSKHRPESRGVTPNK